MKRLILIFALAFALLLLAVLGAVVLAGAADLMAIILGVLLSSATGGS